MVDNDAKAGSKKFPGIEILRETEVSFDHFERLDAIQRIDADPEGLHIAGHKIPPLAEQLDAEWFQFAIESRRIAETPVTDLQRPPLTHGLNDGNEILMPRGDLLEENSITQIAAFVEQCSDREGADQPLPHAVLFEILGIGYVIEVSAVAVAADFDVEDLADRLLVAMERTVGDAGFVQIVVLRTSPAAIDLTARDVTRAVDRIHQPDITVEERCCHI